MVQASQGPAQAQQGQPDEQDIQASFRSSLDDTIEILEKIGPLCGDIDELADMLKLALRNDSQLALIMKQVTPARMRR